MYAFLYGKMWQNFIRQRKKMHLDIGWLKFCSKNHIAHRTANSINGATSWLWCECNRFALYAHEFFHFLYHVGFFFVDSTLFFTWPGVLLSATNECFVVQLETFFTQIEKKKNKFELLHILIQICKIKMNVLDFTTKYFYESFSYKT